MTKIGKGYKLKIASLIISTVFLCNATLYSHPVSLRLPIGDYRREARALATQGYQGNPKDFPNPIRRILPGQLTFKGPKRGGLTRLQEATYIDEYGKQHECFAKWVPWDLDIVYKEYRYIIPQARILRYLNSKNIQGIPKVVDFVQLRNGRVAILFERFPKGETLDKKIKKRRLSKEESVRTMLEVARIVKSLLGEGMYHWDIKPTNIFITDEDEVILFDFDVAFMTREEFIERELYKSGTGAYMSGSRARWSKTFSHADEIYSLGLSLGEVLLGFSLLEYTPEAIIHQLEAREDSISRSLLTFLKKVLSSEDDQGIITHEVSSYKDIDQFLEDFEAVAKEMGVEEAAAAIELPSVDGEREILASMQNVEGEKGEEVPGSLKAKIAKFADSTRARFDDYTTDELILFTRVAFLLSERKGDDYWRIFKNIQEAIDARPNCVAFMHENSDEPWEILYIKIDRSMRDDRRRAYLLGRYINWVLMNIEDHIEDGFGLWVIQFAERPGFHKVTIFDNGKGFPVPVEGEEYPGIGDELFSITNSQYTVSLILNNEEAVLLRGGKIQTIHDVYTFLGTIQTPVIETEAISNIYPFNRGVWLTGYIPTRDFPYNYFDSIKEAIIADFEGWGKRVLPEPETAPEFPSRDSRSGT